jgi:hypothetical protein
MNIRSSKNVALCEGRVVVGAACDAAAACAVLPSVAPRASILAAMIIFFYVNGQGTEWQSPFFG